MSECTIQERLIALQDLSYKEFHRKLIPNVNPDTILGVRVPEIRRLARSIRGTPEAEEFLHQLPHHYYDENILHGALLSFSRSYEETVSLLEEFLPYVDNWAVCDLISPQAFRAHPAALPEQVKMWISSDHPYTIRFGLGVLMSFYLDDCFCPKYLAWAASLRSGEYYVNMMIAWYLATALAKQWEAALQYLTQNRLDPWVHSKTIQKAVESCRISPEQKAFLRTLRIKRDTQRQDETK